MCSLAIYFRSAAHLPLVVAANRDEFLSRPCTAPRMIAADPWVVAGRDLVAGGTWFGVNQDRMVVGLLNRSASSPPDPNRRSRGLLCLEALQARSPTEVAALLRREPPDRYNGFNLLVATEEEAFVATNHQDRLAIRELDAGVHVLTNLDLNDSTCPRIAQSYRLFQSVPFPTPRDRLDGFVDRLRTILSDHVVPLDPRGNSADNTLCVHRDPYGTRSSSIVLYPADRPPSYLHANGPPCRTAYSPVPLPG